MKNIKILDIWLLTTCTGLIAACQTAGSAVDHKSLPATAMSAEQLNLPKGVLLASAGPAIDTTAIPYRQIGLLKSVASTGTGVLVGPRHVLTAAHILYDGTRQKPRTAGMVFIPGKSGDVNPYGSFTLSKALITQEYADTKGEEWDFGLAILDKPIGEKVGWMTLSGDGTINNQTINITGYPNDNGNVIHICTASVQIVGEQQLQHNCGSDPAVTSGSGIYSFDPKTNHREIYGVHILAGTDKDGRNHGVYINKVVLATILQWIDENP